jgi:hypothetical protein
MDAPRTRRENEVWQACDDLWALHANLEALKGDLIRDQLVSLGYKKGSPNEIYKYRSTWKESRGISEKSLAESVQVADPISRAVSLVYEQMQQEAAQKITSIQNESTSQLEALSQQNQELILTCESNLQKYEALAEEKAGLELSIEVLRESLEAQQQENSALKIRQEGLELLLSELKATYLAQIDKLEKQLKQQGYLSSEEINQVKLEARAERDLRITAEANLKKLEKQILTNSAKAQKHQEQVLKKEFQKLTSLVKKFQVKSKIAPSKKEKKEKKRIEPTAHPL